MVKYCLLFLLFGLSFSFSFSRTNYFSKYTSKNKIKIGYAYNTFNNILAKRLLANTDVLLPSNNPTFRQIDNEQQFKLGSINLAFEHRVKPKLAVGAAFTTEFQTRTYTTPYKDSVFALRTFKQYYAFMPCIYFHYLEHNLIDLYLGTDFGLLLLMSKTAETNYDYGNDRSSKLLPTLNFCPFGIQLKTVVSPYLQFNIGSRGWIEGGIVFNLE